MLTELKESGICKALSFNPTIFSVQHNFFHQIPITKMTGVMDWLGSFWMVAAFLSLLWHMNDMFWLQGLCDRIYQSFTFQVHAVNLSENMLSTTNMWPDQSREDNTPPELFWGFCFSIEKKAKQPIPIDWKIAFKVRTILYSLVSSGVIRPIIP